MAVKETGIKRTEDGGVFCEACGNDLTEGASAKFVAHMDGRNTYKNVFECGKCGAILTQECERTATGAKWRTE